MFALFFTTILVVKSDAQDLGQYISQLDFQKADSISRVMDKNASVPHFSFITQLFRNNGQFPKQDLEILKALENQNDSENAILHDLIKGLYFLFNEKSNEQSFEYLARFILQAKEDTQQPLLNLGYLAILQLYSREFVQSSDDYLDYLHEFKSLAKSTNDKAWYYLHRVEYMTKSASLDRIEDYYKAYSDLERHFADYELSGFLQAHFFFNKSLFLRFEKRYKEARSAYIETIELTQDVAFLKYIRFSSYIHLASVEAQLGNFEDARLSISAANNHWDVSDSVRSEVIYNRFAAYYYYEKVGLFDSAYLLLRKANDLEPQLDFRKNTLKISELNVKLKTAEKERDLIAQENEIVSKNRLIRTVLGFTILLSASLAALVVAFKKIKSKNKRIETLMRELHHRVKNNLQVVSSLLGLQSMKLESESARKAVSEGKGRIRAMSLIHQKLYQNDEVTHLNIRQYITNLTNELTISYGFGQRVELIIDVPEISMDADLALPVGLIVNELVSNAYKYAYEGIKDPLLELTLREQANNSLVLKIRDNGLGFPDGFDFEHASSFGMKLVKLLTRQLGGSMKINEDSGVVYSLEFKAT